MATTNSKNSQGKKPSKGRNKATRLKYSQKAMIEAINDTGGIVTNICERLGCSRQTFYDYLRKFPKIERALQDERDKILDLGEGSLYALVQGGDFNATKYLLNCKGKDRGWGETQQIQQETTSRRVIFVAPEQFESPEEWAKKHKNS